MISGSCSFLLLLASHTAAQETFFCPSAWPVDAADRLDDLIEQNLFGQPYARSQARSLIRFEGEQTRAVTMSFHGNTGTGKSFTAALVLQALGVKGKAKSGMGMLQEGFGKAGATVAKLIGQKGFKENIHGDKNYRYLTLLGTDYGCAGDGKSCKKETTEELATGLRKRIQALFQRCPHSALVIEEAHFMKIGLAEHLLKLFTSTGEVDGTDYSKGVVIFTTNMLGVDAVQRAYFDYVKKQLDLGADGKPYDKKRFFKQLKEDKLRQIVFKAAKQTEEENEGGMLTSASEIGMGKNFFVEGNLAALVPFLPLHERDLVSCINARLENFPKKDRTHGMDRYGELIYDREDIGTALRDHATMMKKSPAKMFLLNGCKEINDLVVKLVNDPLAAFLNGRKPKNFGVHDHCEYSLLSGLRLTDAKCWKHSQSKVHIAWPKGADEAVITAAATVKQEL